MTAFLRGAGGFSKSSNPFSYSNYPANQVSVVKFPESQPFSVFEDRTNPSQACKIIDFILFEFSLLLSFHPYFWLLQHSFTEFSFQSSLWHIWLETVWLITSLFLDKHKILNQSYYIIMWSVIPTTISMLFLSSLHYLDTFPPVLLRVHLIAYWFCTENCWGLG